jgi:CO/xanthine dehydrogenase Mo-binding subunit
MPVHNVVGLSIPRTEGAEKVCGRTIYAADVNLEGTLWAKILRSPLPHARIRGIDVSRALRVPGVRAIVTGRDIPHHYFGKEIRDMPVLCWDRVRFVGDRVASVAAETSDAAEEATRAIVVDYEELPAVFDPIEAMRTEAPLLHEDSMCTTG